MYKKYGTEINITAIATDYIASFYDNLNYFIAYETDEELSDLINIFPEIEKDILDEAMRLITIDYCKKKVAENESKKGE